MNPGDTVVVKKDKSSLYPPWDPRPFTVTNVKGTKVFLEWDDQPKVRFKDNCKLIKFPVGDNSTVLAGDRIVKVDDDDDFCKNLVLNNVRTRVEQAVVDGFLNNNLEDLVPNL